MQEVADKPQEQQQQQQEQVRTYSQEEVDRITAKVRRNASHETEARVRREVQSGGQQHQEQEQRQEPKVEQPPKREDFPDYESFLDAKSAFVARTEARKEREEAAREERLRRDEEAKVERGRTFKKHADSLIDEIPDFAEVIGEARDVPISGAMAEVMEDAGAMGPRILYYFAKNRAEASRISELTVLKRGASEGEIRAAIRKAGQEIGKIEAKLEAEIAAKKKAKEPAPKEGEEQEQQQGQKKTEEEEEAEQRREHEERARSGDGRFKADDKAGRKAPEPIEPGSGRSANRDQGPQDKDSDSGWYEKRLAQEKAEREKRRR